jgi:hypothetical protein
MNIKYLGLLITLSFFGCRSVPTSTVVAREYTTIDHEFEEVLVSGRDSDSVISRMIFRIEGTITGDAVIILKHPPFDQNSRTVERKINIGGKINKVIKGEWYEKECLLRYIPNDPSVTGKIIISYQAF